MDGQLTGRDRRASTPAGFTLVEVMVVLVIIGVFASMITLGIDKVLGRDREREIERLRHVLELASDEAAIRGRPLSVEFLPHGYRFSGLDASGEWQMLFSPTEFTERGWVEGVAPLRLEIAGRALTPPLRIVFGSEPVEFRLDLRNEEQRKTITGLITGNITLADTPPEPAP